MTDTRFEAKGSELTVSRTFDAPIGLVWKAWTEAELLDQWWAPQPWKSKTKMMEFKPGGQRLYAMCGPDGEEHWGLTTYGSIHKPQSFSGQDAFCDAEGQVNPALPVAEFLNRFEDKGQATTVIAITKYASEEHLRQVIDMGMKEGLSMAYENLDSLMERLQA